MRHRQRYSCHRGDADNLDSPLLQCNQRLFCQTVINFMLLLTQFCAPGDMFLLFTHITRDDTVWAVFIYIKKLVIVMLKSKELVNRFGFPLKEHGVCLRTLALGSCGTGTQFARCCNLL